MDMMGRGADPSFDNEDSFLLLQQQWGPPKGPDIAD